MQNYSQYITETADNGSDLKKAVKNNGFTIPTSFKYVGGRAKIYNYYSKQGFRGEATVQGVQEKLVAAGWTKFEDYDKFTPDGSTVSYHTVLLSPDKTVLYKSNCSYGGTSWDNHYSAEFRLVSTEEAELTKRKTFEEIDNYLKECGIRYCSWDEINDELVWVNTGASVRDIVKKMDSWKSVGVNEWEKGNCRVKFEEGGVWGKILVSLIKPVKPVKIQ